MLATIYSYFFSIRCGAEPGYFGIAVFAVIITGMNDGARWHKLYARGDPFQADDDGPAQHSPPEAVLWRSSMSSHIVIRHPRGCYVLSRERRILQSALSSSCSTCMRCYHWREIGFVRFLKTDQMSRGNASAVFFRLLFWAYPYCN